MPAVSRVGDSLSTGHICTSTTTIASSNTDGTVKANGINIIVVGALSVAHPNPPSPVANHVAILMQVQEQLELIVLQLVE